MIFKVMQFLLVLSFSSPILLGGVPIFSTNQTQNVSEQSKIIREAEENKFTVRRIEICCNIRVRDEVLRRRIALLEGEIFTKKLLEQSVIQLNTLKSIKPVRLKDIEVHLDRENKLIDFAFFVYERRRSRLPKV